MCRLHSKRLLFFGGLVHLVWGTGHFGEPVRASGALPYRTLATAAVAQTAAFEQVNDSGRKVTFVSYTPAPLRVCVYNANDSIMACN